MQSIEEILRDKIEKFNRNPLEALKTIGSDYKKRWAKGVSFFQIKINEDRKKENLSELPFMAIREKLVAIKEIDDLRWFYGVCKKYATTKDKNGKQNTFSRCFFGALKNIK